MALPWGRATAPLQAALADRPGSNYLKKKENFIYDDIRPAADCKSSTAITLPCIAGAVQRMEPRGHTSGFSGSRQVHSGTGGVIKGQYGVELAGFENKVR
jgi:hypothetical protein